MLQINTKNLDIVIVTAHHVSDLFICVIESAAHKSNAEVALCVMLLTRKYSILGYDADVKNL